jgi:8-hydroxy-5-deazaflavin:NADPH oxidoreductase
MKVGIVGTGKIGSTVGALLVNAGANVLFSSRHPAALAAFVQSLGGNARAGTPLQAAQHGDVVLLSVPLGAVPTLGEELRTAVVGKAVLDTTNQFPGRDGADAAAAVAAGRGSGVWTAGHFPGAHVVKAFNTVNFATLKERAHGAEPDLAIPLAGDDASALGVASELVRAAGFEPVVIGVLERARDFDVGTAPFGQALTARQLRGLLR